MKYQLLLVVVSLCAVQSSADARLSNREKKEFVVAHRLSEWHTEHFDDAAKAQQHTAAIKQLGAEVKVDKHQTHIDVTYRSVRWKPLRLKSDELAHQWQNWLKAAGFETVHGHSPNHDKHAHPVQQAHHEEHAHDHNQEHGEVLLYRSSNWATQHFDDAAAAEQFVTLAEALRCDVKQAAHAGHTDIRFHCPEWTAVEFADHKTAEAWEKWLASAGFEVRHEDPKHNH